MKKCRSCQKEIDDKAKKCPYCQEKQGNWAQRHPILTGILGIIAFMFVVGAVSGAGNSGTSNKADTTPNAVEEAMGANENSQDVATSETPSQKNAVRKADSYLSISGFSRDGLIKQLEFDQFSTEDATYAVDSVDADWNEQAAKKAKSYLDISGFSRDGLIDQLKFDGFTSEEAAYGVDAAGL